MAHLVWGTKKVFRCGKTHLWHSIQQWMDLRKVDWKVFWNRPETLLQPSFFQFSKRKFKNERNSSLTCLINWQVKIYIESISFQICKICFPFQTYCKCAIFYFLYPQMIWKYLNLKISHDVNSWKFIPPLYILKPINPCMSSAKKVKDGR